MSKDKKSAKAKAVATTTKFVNATPKDARLFTKGGKIMHFDLGLAKEIIPILSNNVCFLPVAWPTPW